MYNNSCLFVSWKTLKDLFLQVIPAKILLQHELQRAEVFLETMGYKARTEVRNVDINLSYQEAKEYGKIFRQFDKDRDGHISIHDLRKALHVRWFTSTYAYSTVVIRND